MSDADQTQDAPSQEDQAQNLLESIFTPEPSDEPSGQPEGDTDTPLDGDDSSPDQEEQQSDETGEGADDQIPAIDPGAVAHATSLGYSAEQAEALHQAGMLDTVLINADIRIADIGRQQEAAPALQEPEPEPPQPYQVTLDEAEFDPALKEALQGVSNEYHAREQAQAEQITALRAELDGIIGHFDEQATAAYTAEFDAGIAELGEDYEDVFGKGSAADIQRGTPEHTNRTRVWNEIDAGVIGRERTGQPPIPFKEAQMRVVRALFPDKGKQAVRRNIANQLRDQQGRFSGRPSQREMPAPDFGRDPDDQAAVDALKATGKFNRD